MSELQFPKYPIVGQEYDFPPYRYYWDGVKWKTKGIGYNPVNDLRNELEPRISDNESKAFEALRRSYAEAGYHLVSGSFEVGGVLVNANDVLLYEETGVAYAYSGTLPHTVAEGETPSSAGWVSRENKNAISISLEDWGVSTTNTPEANAAVFITAIKSGIPIAPPQRAYTFQFDGQPITYTGSVLDIDLGPHKHTFINYGGITANSLLALRYNGRFTANSGYCKGLGSFRNLMVLDIDVIEITDVFCDSPTSAQQFFGLEYSSNTFGDNVFVMNIRSAIFINVKTKTPDLPNATPMTGIGNFGSSSSQSKQHLLAIGNLYVENFYTVGADGITPIGGDSDFFRLFTNPTLLTIGNCYISNVGKRFIKTQEEAHVIVENLVTKLDSRFSTTNYNGTFEGQSANSGNPTRFTILKAEIDYPSGLTPVFFNASGLPHSMIIEGAKFKNLGVYMQNVAGEFTIKKSSGGGLSGTMPQSKKCRIEDCEITNFRGTNSANTVVVRSSISLADDYASTAFPFGNSPAIFQNVELLNWDTNVRVCIFKHIDKVTLSRTRGTSMRRPFVPETGKNCTFVDVEMLGIDTTAAAIESPGAGTTGSVVCRGYRSTTALAYVSSGTWAFILDDCASDVVTGAGVASISRAIYGAKLLSAVASLDFGSIPANSSVELTMTLAGVTTSSGVTFASPQATLLPSLVWSARVSGADTVSVRVANISTGAVTVPVVNWRADCLMHL